MVYKFLVIIMDYIKVILGFYTNWLLGFWGEQLIVPTPPPSWIWNQLKGGYQKVRAKSIAFLTDKADWREDSFRFGAESPSY